MVIGFEDLRLALFAGLIAGALALLGEWLHARRLRRARFLAFGPAGHAKPWVAVVPLVRCLAVASLAFALVVLHEFRAEGDEEIDPDQEPSKHLVIALDVSPSMYLEDSGPSGRDSRWERARDLLTAVMQRLDMEQTRVSVMAFYTEAKPVVIRSFDMGVVLNVLDGLPLEHAFEVGSTQLQAGVQAAIDMTRGWPPASTTLIVVSDGDAVGGATMPRRTPAIADVLVLGVGDPYRGAEVAGRTSRQDHESLQRLAVRLEGRYHDGNALHLPTDVVRALTASLPQVTTKSELRNIALALVGLSTSLLALIPLLLSLGGGSRSSRSGVRLDPSHSGRSAA
jgi:Ca-activated chloride channel family protein